LTLPADATAARTVRHALAAVLEGAREQWVDDVMVATSELVTNAARHTHEPFRVDAWVDGETPSVRVEVADRSPAMPALRHPGTGGRPGGWGLHLVREFSADWGAVRMSAGKVVWFVSRDGAAGDAVVRCADPAERTGG